MDPNFVVPHKFSCQFDFHEEPNFAGQFAVMSLCWRDLDLTNKLKHEVFVFARLFREEISLMLSMNSKLLHALCANVVRLHH